MELFKNPVAIFDNIEAASKEVARRIIDQIKAKNDSGKVYVLGLATGATPIVLYKELIRLHKEEGFSFKNVVTFNLDEYYPMQKDDHHSYYYFMHHNLFNHIDIPAHNINIPDGTVTRDDRAKFCEEYEDKIKTLGGLDFQVLGIGRTGHIGFNEPGSEVNSKTRAVTLADITIQDAIKDFGSEASVPREAITMGVGTILGAKEIALMAFGENKADIIHRAIQGEVSSSVPASFLQNHANARYYLNADAAQKLTL